MEKKFKLEQNAYHIIMGQLAENLEEFCDIECVT